MNEGEASKIRGASQNRAIEAPAVNFLKPSDASHAISRCERVSERASRRKQAVINRARFSNFAPFSLSGGPSSVGQRRADVGGGTAKDEELPTEPLRVSIFLRPFCADPIVRHCIYRSSRA